MMKTRTKVVLSLIAGFGTVIAYNKYKESRKRLSDDCHVVIVGAGYGGVSLAEKINGKGKYTLIDSKDCLHHNMASLRAVVQPGYAKKLFIPYAPKFKENFKQGHVVGIDPNNKTVSLASEENPISYTHLVIATGSKGPFPGKCDYTAPTSQLVTQYEDCATALKGAKKVVVIGGGAVGVEMAAEIAHEYPEKSVTMIHNTDTLVSRKLVPDALQRIEKRLEEMKVNVIKQDTVDNMDEIALNTLQQGMMVKTSNGKQLDADFVIPCVGLTVNSQAYASSLPAQVNQRGQLMVDRNLRVKGLQNVYAIGDCNDLPAGKLAMEAAIQANHLWNALVTKKEIPYPENTFRIVVPLGPNGGVCQNGKWVIGDWLAKKMKASDVFTTFAWKFMRQKVPED